MRSMTVYCSSSDRLKSHFYDVAYEFGGALAQRNFALIYGGGKVGLMGRVADGALAQGARVEGVIPGFLASKEIAHTGLSHLHIVENMHQRKMLMANLGDAYITLPGGFGTLEELMEMLTWKQIGQHQKPIVLLNIERFWDSLIDFFDQLLDESMISLRDKQLYHISETIEDVFSYLASYAIQPDGQ